jgi:hypothetical protein
MFIMTDFILGSYLPKLPQRTSLAQTPYLPKDLGWYELKPNYLGFDTYGPLRFAVATDSYGFRKGVGQKDIAKCDVVFLGDSFTYGINGPWEDTFVGMYESASGKPVLNTGVPSYSPTAYVHQYRKALSAGLLQRGHVVVIGLDVSDVQDEAGRWTDGDSHPRDLDEAKAAFEEITRRKEEEANAAQVLLRQRCWRLQGAARDCLPLTRQLYEFVRYGSSAGGSQLSQQAPPADEVFSRARSAFTHRDWDVLNAEPAYDSYKGFSPLGVMGGLARVERKVREIIEIARDQQAKVYVLIYPWPAQLYYEDKFSWADHVRTMCGRISCDGVIDMIQPFRVLAKRDAEWYQHYYVVGDIHFNRDGNRIIAEELVKIIP